jgi:CHAD domain-containing protein
MPVNIISEHWLPLQEKSETLLQQLKQQNSKEEVHDIRVLIKHFRAYCRLYENILQKKKGCGTLAATKVFFSVLGRQRDLEMSLELLSSFEKETGKYYLAFKDFIAGNLMKAKLEADQSVSGFQLNEIIKTGEEIKLRLSPFAEDKIVSGIKKECRNTISKTRLLAEDFEKNAHMIRKLLKRLGYWLKLLPEQKLLNKKETDLLTALLDDLGQWQDNRMLIKEIDSFLQTKTLSLKKEKLYKNLQKQVERVNIHLLKMAGATFLQIKKAA